MNNLIHSNIKLWVTTVVLFSLLVISGASSANEKRFNVRLSPVVLAIGAVDVEADIKVMDKLTISPMFTTWGLEVNSDEFSITGYGARVNYHFNGALKQGAYATGFYKMWNYEVSNTDPLTSIKSTGSVGVNVFAAMIGYQWMWDNMNMNIGAGYGVGSAGQIELKDSTGTVSKSVDAGDAMSAGPVFDFSMGYAF